MPLLIKVLRLSYSEAKNSGKETGNENQDAPEGWSVQTLCKTAPLARRVPRFAGLDRDELRSPLLRGALNEGRANDQTPR
jgi:hypothetical protein